MEVFLHSSDPIDEIESVLIEKDGVSMPPPFISDPLVVATFGVIGFFLLIGLLLLPMYFERKAKKNMKKE